MERGAAAEGEFIGGELAQAALFQLDSGLAAAGGQNRNELAQIRFVADEEDSLGFFVVDFRDQLEGVTVGLEEFA